MIPSTKLNAERVSIFMWKSQPTQRSRTVRIRAAASSGGDERDVRVLERGLAGRDATDRVRIELREDRMGQFEPRRRLHDQQLLLLLILDGHGPDAGEIPNPRDGGLVDPEDLDLDDAAVGHARLQLPRGALGDDLA